MKKKIVLVMLLLILINLTGCMRVIDLKDRAIVQAIGIDYKNDEYVVTLQVFSPESAGAQTSVDPSKQNAKLIKTSGPTVANAISSATLKQGKNPFYGHNKIIVIGETLAKHGIDDFISFFSIDNNSKPNVSVLLSKGDAHDILNSETSQGTMPAETIQKMIDNANESGRTNKIRFFDLVKNDKNITTSLMIPIIEIKKQEGSSPDNKDQTSQQGNQQQSNQQQGSQQQSSQQQGEEMTQQSDGSSAGGSSDKESGGSSGGGSSEGGGSEKKVIQDLALSGAGVFSDGKIIGYLNNDEIMGSRFIKGNITSANISSISEETGIVSADVFTTNSKLSTSLSGDKVILDINIKSNAAITELSKYNNRNLNVNDHHKISELIAEKIKYLCELVLEKTLKEQNVDIFNIFDRVWQQHPSFWKQNRDDWKKIINQIEYNINVDINIDRIGI